MRAILTVAHLTIHEAGRRRIVLAAFLCGLAFLVLYGIGLHFIARSLEGEAKMEMFQRRMVLSMFAIVGLYAANFLSVMAAVLVPIDTLSGEITSGVMQTLASKPVRRSEILLGKWLASAALVGFYLLFLAVGVLTIVRLRGGFCPPHVTIGLPLMLLEVTVIVTLAILFGTRLSTIANGITVFGFYGLAFIGGWVEQIGSFTGNDATRTIGTIVSLIVPSETLWQLAAHHMQPPIMRDLHMTPFSPVNVPSAAMVWWAAGYVAVGLLIALRSFRTRAL